jgi:hypothetical protein
LRNGLKFVFVVIFPADTSLADASGSEVALFVESILAEGSPPDGSLADRSLAMVPEFLVDSTTGLAKNI